MTSKIAKRFSLRTLLILFTILAFVCLFLEGYRDQIVHGKLTATVAQDYNVSPDFNIKGLRENLNSTGFVTNLRKQNYDHYRILHCWDHAIHGFNVSISAEGTFSKNIRIESIYPIYAVRERKFAWGFPPYDQRFFANGLDGKGKRVADQNRALYQVIFDQVVTEIGRLK